MQCFSEHIFSQLAGKAVTIGDGDQYLNTLASPIAGKQVTQDRWDAKLHAYPGSDKDVCFSWWFPY